MTQEDKLKKIVRRSISNGWRFPGMKKKITEDQIEKLDISVTEENRIIFVDGGIWVMFEIGVNELLFSKKFAKPYWGEEIVDWHDSVDMPKFEYHLQGVVISDNPIDYYYDNQ